MPRNVRPFILDGGNLNIKYRLWNNDGAVEGHFPHVFTELDGGTFKRIAARQGATDPEYFTVNGTHYAIGAKGKRHGTFERRHGAKRYTKDYYGIFLAMAMAMGFKESASVYLVGSHAPRDVGYTNDLMDAAMGEWVVEWNGATYKFNVVNGTPFDEPLGVWANTVLRADGQAYANKAINGGVTLVLDIGGYTTDGLVIDPGGQVDYSTATSESIGVINAVRDFEKNFKTHNTVLLKDVPRLDETKVNDAIRTGVFDLRGLGSVDCALLAQETRQALANDVYGFYESFGGAAEYDCIILTGGGSALVYKELVAAIQHGNILVADPHQEMDKLFLSNVRGGAKWFLLQKKLGMVSA